MLFVSCLTPWECCPVPALPCTACFCCVLLSLPCSWAVLICRTSFSSGLHISWLSWSILPLGRELKDGTAAIPVGLSWTASVGFSRGMVGREWSGWGWSFLRVEGWRSQITQQFSQILDTHRLQRDLTLQAELWFLYGRLDVSFTSGRT